MRAGAENIAPACSHRIGDPEVGCRDKTHDYDSSFFYIEDLFFTKKNLADRVQAQNTVTDWIYLG